MRRWNSLPRALRVAALSAGVLLLIAVVVPPLLSPLLASGVHAFARSRGFEASWSRLAFQWPAVVTLRDLRFRHAADGATVFEAGRADASLAPRLGRLRPRVVRLVLERARIALPAAREDTGEPNPSEEQSRSGPAAPRVRAAAEQAVEVLLLPARRLPELRLADIDVVGGDSLFVRLDALSLVHDAGGV